MEISKRSFITKVTEFMQEAVKKDGVKVDTIMRDDMVVFENFECDFNAITSEYDKIVAAYYRVLEGVYENIEAVIDCDKNFDKEMVGFVYMLAVSSSYEIFDEKNEITIRFLDETYAKYVIELFYLEWARVNIELPAEKYEEVLNRITNVFLGVNN